MRALATVLAAFALFACENEFASSDLGMSFSPPRGVKLVSSEAGVTLSGEVVSERSDARNVGPGARWILRDAQTRTIVYFVAAEHRYLLFVQRAWEQGHLEATDDLELAVASLKLTPWRAAGSRDLAAGRAHLPCDGPRRRL